MDEIIDDMIHDLIESYLQPYNNNDHLDISELTSNGIKFFVHVEHYSSFYTLTSSQMGSIMSSKKFVMFLKTYP